MRSNASLNPSSLPQIPQRDRSASSSGREFDRDTGRLSNCFKTADPRARDYRPSTSGRISIESCSDSEDGDAHFLARERQRQSRCRGGRRADASDLSSSEEEYETLVLGETQEATLERVRRELQAKQAQYDSLLRAMEDAPPAVL